MMSPDTKIYIQTPKWFLRPTNTDWRYTRFTIPRIQEFERNCVFYAARSNWTAFHVNARYARHVLCRKLKISFEQDPHSVLDRKEFAQSGSQLVFCHDDFPGNAGGIAVVWQNSILDRAMTLAWGASKEQLDIEYEVKKSGFLKAAVVQVSTEAERERLCAWFPEVAEKFVAVPFFLPDVTPIDLDRMNEKIERSGPLRCLFVGHEAKRKGLGRIYAAIERLPTSVQRQVHLTVISGQTDGTIATPLLPNLQVMDAVPHDQVLQLMRQSDVFLMPSYFESYGLVYLEAMAQGTIPVVPDWEVQREIVDGGRAGIVTSGEAIDLAASLERLCDDAELRTGLAISARQRFEQFFAPSIVARKYTTLFHRVAHQRGERELGVTL